MLKYFTFLFTICLLWQCQNNSTNTASEESISSLEAAYEANPSGENLQLLLDAYNTDPTDTYLEKKAYLELSNNRFQDGMTSLKTLMEKEVTAERAINLAGAYEQQQKPLVAQTAYQAYLLSYPNHQQAEMVKSKLGSDIPKLSDRLSSLFYAAENDSLRRSNPNVINDFISSVQAVALVAPQVDSVAIQMKRAANFAQYYQRDIPKALNIYQQIVDRFPNTKERESAMFTLAFIYEEELSQLDKAKIAYETFIKEYPNSELADDANVLLQNLGKDDAEILEELLKKQAQQ